MNGDIAFKHGSEKLTREWLAEHSDSVSIFTSDIPSGGQYRSFTYTFEVEHEDDENYVHLEVGICEKYHPNEAYCVNIVTRCSGSEPDRGHVGLFTLRDDVRALLEILARGNHF